MHLHAHGHARPTEVLVLLPHLTRIIIHLNAHGHARHTEVLVLLPHLTWSIVHLHPPEDALVKERKSQQRDISNRPFGKCQKEDALSLEHHLKSTAQQQ